MSSGAVRSDPEVDLSIVIVHGIGQQASGTTLLNWAEPILGELRSQLETSGGKITYTSASLAVDPSCVRVSFINPAGSGRLIWEFVEARWADAFPVPSAREVLRWACVFSARAASRYGRQLMRPVWPLFATFLSDSTVINPPVSRLTALVFAVLGSPFLLIWSAILFSALLLATGGAFILAAALIVVGLVPILGKKVSGITTGLVSSVGDAYLFNSRPVHTAAMMTTFAGVLKSREAKRTAVIAHSQGAAVALQTLLQDGAADVDVLFTVGAGISLLEDDAKPVSSWLRIAPRMQWVNIWTLWDPVPAGPMADEHRSATNRLREASKANFFGHEVLPLEDCCESGDASLKSRIRKLATWEAVEGPEEWPVYNRASIFADQISYQKNITQVIRPMTDRLIALANDAEGDLPAINDAQIVRVRQLGTLRVAVLMFILALLNVELYGFTTLISRLQESGFGKDQFVERYENSIPEGIMGSLISFWPVIVFVLTVAATFVLVYGSLYQFWGVANNSASRRVPGSWTEFIYRSALGALGISGFAALTVVFGMTTGALPKTEGVYDEEGYLIGLNDAPWGPEAALLAIPFVFGVLVCLWPYRGARVRPIAARLVASKRL